MGIRIEGEEDVIKFLDRYSKKVDKVLDAGLEKGAKEILSKSNEIAPRDTGNMIRETSTDKVDNLEYEVRYNSDYSLYVHEDLEARHPNGQAKFLQEATNQKGRKVIKDIAKAIGRIKK